MHDPAEILAGLSEQQRGAVRDLLETAYCCGYYHDGYTHDSAYSAARAKKCADELLNPSSPTALPSGPDRSTDNVESPSLDAGAGSEQALTIIPTCIPANNSHNGTEPVVTSPPRSAAHGRACAMGDAFGEMLGDGRKHN